MAKETEAPSFSADQLAMISAVVSAAVAEAKKPAPPTESQLAQIQQEQDLRLQQRDLVLQKEINKKANQDACSHHRSARDGGGTTGVYVQNGNYIICQQCQAVIRPEVAEKDRDQASFYNTRLFNALFQEAL